MPWNVTPLDKWPMVLYTTYMADGRAHAIASVILSGPVFLAGVAIDPKVGMAASAGCLCGILLTPDLDQEGISAAEWQIVKKTFGVGFLWLMFWWAYAKFIPHRHWASHTPIVGTLGRLAYMALAMICLFWLTGWSVPHIPLWLAGGFVMGLIVSDTAHWVMDR